MFNLIKEFKNAENYISPLTNPFRNDKIERIYMSIRKRTFGSGEICISGAIEFRNGSTKGEQQFETESFEDLIKHIKSFIENL